MAATPKGLGRVQRAVWRALLIADCPVTTAEVVAWAYPRRQKVGRAEWLSIRRAAERVAVLVGRSSNGKGRPCVWRMK